MDARDKEKKEEGKRDVDIHTTMEKELYIYALTNQVFTIYISKLQ